MEHSPAICQLCMIAVLGIKGKLLPESRTERFGDTKRLTRHSLIYRFAGVANGSGIGIKALQLRSKHLHGWFHAEAKFQERYQMVGFPEWDRVTYVSENSQVYSGNKGRSLSPFF